MRNAGWLILTLICLPLCGCASKDTTAYDTSGLAATRPSDVNGMSMDAENAYPIRLTRPRKASDSYDVHIQIELDIVGNATGAMTGADGKDHAVTAIKGDLTGRVDVISVDNQGEPKDFIMKIVRFTAGPDEQAAAAPGSVLVVSRATKKAVYSLRGGAPLTIHGTDALGLMYPALDENPVSDDDVYGSAVLRRAGESWAINAGPAARQEAAGGTMVDAKEIVGRTTLEGVEQTALGPALRISETMIANRVRVSNAPPGLIVDNAATKNETRVLLPVEASSGPLETDSDTEVRMAGRIFPIPVKLNFTMSVHYKEAMTPVK